MPSGPNFNPQETSSLMALLAGLRGGMDPTQAYGIYGDVLNQSMARTAEHKESLKTLTDLLTANAQAGLPLKGVQALADAYTHGATTPPRIEDTISGLYPTQNVPAPGSGSQAQGQQYQIAGRGGVQQGVPFGASPPEMVTQQARISPTYMPPTSAQDPMQRLQLQQARGEMQAQQQTAEAQASLMPAVAAAFATKASASVGTDPTGTGVPMTAEDVMSQLVTSEAFLALDPQTQAAVVAEVRKALEVSGGGAAPEGTQPGWPGRTAVNSGGYVPAGTPPAADAGSFASGHPTPGGGFWDTFWSNFGRF